MERVNSFAYDENTQEINSYEKEYYASEEMQEYIRENEMGELEDFLIRE